MSRPTPRSDLLARLRTSDAPWHGPPPRLPELLDRASDRWFGLPPRIRAAVLVLGATVVLVVAGAGAARSPWGPPVTVLVTAVDLEAGAPIGPEHVRTERRPSRLVPDDALTGLDAVAGSQAAGFHASGAPPAGTRAAGMLVAGTVLTARHVAGGDAVTDALADGRAAYAVESASLPPLRVGQRLDLVAGDLEGHGRTLARDVRVVGVGDGTVWLDVAREDAPAIAAAALRDGLQVVLLAP